MNIEALYINVLCQRDRSGSTHNNKTPGSNSTPKTKSAVQHADLQPPKQSSCFCANRATSTVPVYKSCKLIRAHSFPAQILTIDGKQPAVLAVAFVDHMQYCADASCAHNGLSVTVHTSPLPAKQTPQPAFTGGQVRLPAATLICFSWQGFAAEAQTCHSNIKIPSLAGQP